MRAILTYHSIDDSGSPISISPAAFAGHLEWLASGAVRVVSLDQLAAAGEGEDLVAITFDDGCANFATEVAPGLGERGLPATLFVVTDHAGGDNAWGGRPDPRVPELALLDWDALGRLAEAGIAIGSHTRTHPRLAGLEPGRLEDELAESAASLEHRLGRRPGWLAYPYGSVDPAVTAAARRHYRGGVTTEHREVRAGDDRLRLPRLDAYYFRNADGLDRWGSATFRSGVWLRRQARRARAVWEQAAGAAGWAGGGGGGGGGGDTREGRGR
jgi:peptidoglycan/xylan/chitin deacetylase (PgdA/CDA1 family)